MQNIINQLKLGNFVIVVDDKNREDEADLVIAGEHITPEKIAFMLDHCCGIICAPMSLERVKKIGIPIINNLIEKQSIKNIIRQNQNNKTAPFTIAVDAKECHTGVSAYDRFLTIKKLCDDDASIDDFIAPGHMFPLYAHPNGLKKRKGHTEAAVELMKLAGLKDIAVICELMNTSANIDSRDNTNINDKNNREEKNNKLGTMMKDKDVQRFSEKHNIPIINIKDIIQ
ncbi:MAG: 3,4-dihydroxy-2-butanone-4-phosphate synthase [Candidatus Woesearchaeota archaeon]